MARKLHLAVMSDSQLEQHRLWLLMEHAACIAERELRAECAMIGLDAQARLCHQNDDGSWTLVPDELGPERALSAVEHLAR